MTKLVVMIFAFGIVVASTVHAQPAPMTEAEVLTAYVHGVFGKLAKQFPCTARTEYLLMQVPETSCMDAHVQTRAHQRAVLAAQAAEIKLLTEMQERGVTWVHPDARATAMHMSQTLEAIAREVAHGAEMDAAYEAQQWRNAVRVRVRVESRR
jgi:hypothetical protein